MAMTSVEVIQKNGSVSFGRATADEFDAGTLTVSWVDAESAQYGPARVFPPDQWQECRVFGSDGHPLFAFVNNRAWQGHVESRELRRRSA
jgi:hypothetical protein